MIDFYENQMIKVLFVCLGNICRSPMAEGIFNAKIKDLGLEKAIQLKHKKIKTKVFNKEELKKFEVDNLEY